MSVSTMDQHFFVGWVFGTVDSVCVVVSHNPTGKDDARAAHRATCCWSMRAQNNLSTIKRLDKVPGFIDGQCIACSKTNRTDRNL
jgi:hypothetical protein